MNRYPISSTPGGSKNWRTNYNAQHTQEMPQISFYPDTPSPAAQVREDELNLVAEHRDLHFQFLNPSQARLDHDEKAVDSTRRLDIETDSDLDLGKRLADLLFAGPADGCVNFEACQREIADVIGRAYRCSGDFRRLLHYRIDRDGGPQCYLSDQGPLSVTVERTRDGTERIVLTANLSPWLDGTRPTYESTEESQRLTPLRAYLQLIVRVLTDLPDNEQDHPLGANGEYTNAVCKACGLIEPPCVTYEPLNRFGPEVRVDEPLDLPAARADSPLEVDRMPSASSSRSSALNPSIVNDQYYLRYASPLTTGQPGLVFAPTVTPFALAAAQPLDLSTPKQFTLATDRTALPALANSPMVVDWAMPGLPSPSGTLSQPSVNNPAYLPHTSTLTPDYPPLAHASPVVPLALVTARPLDLTMPKQTTLETNATGARPVPFGFAASTSTASQVALSVPVTPTGITVAHTAATPPAIESQALGIAEAMEVIDEASLTAAMTLLELSEQPRITVAHTATTSPAIESQAHGIPEAMEVIDETPLTAAKTLLELSEQPRVFSTSTPQNAAAQAPAISIDPRMALLNGLLSAAVSLLKATSPADALKEHELNALLTSRDARDSLVNALVSRPHASTTTTHTALIQAGSWWLELLNTQVKGGRVLPETALSLITRPCSQGGAGALAPSLAARAVRYPNEIRLLARLLDTIVRATSAKQVHNALLNARSPSLYGRFNESQHFYKSLRSGTGTQHDSLIGLFRDLDLLPDDAKIAQKMRHKKASAANETLPPERSPLEIANDIKLNLSDTILARVAGELGVAEIASQQQTARAAQENELRELFRAEYLKCYAEESEKVKKNLQGTAFLSALMDATGTYRDAYFAASHQVKSKPSDEEISRFVNAQMDRPEIQEILNSASLNATASDRTALMNGDKLRQQARTTLQPSRDTLERQARHDAAQAAKRLASVYPKRNAGDAKEVIRQAVVAAQSDIADAEVRKRQEVETRRQIQERAHIAVADAIKAAAVISAPSSSRAPVDSINTNDAWVQQTLSRAPELPPVPIFELLSSAPSVPTREPARAERASREKLRRDQ